MILIFLVAGFATVYICGIAAYCKCILFDRSKFFF